MFYHLQYLYHYHLFLQYQLKNIYFYGNKLFTHDEIKQIVHISINENFNPLQIRRELKILKRKYLMEGKVDIVIMDEVTIEEKNVIARINIFEGSTYHIQNIFITFLTNLQIQLNCNTNS